MRLTNRLLIASIGITAASLGSAQLWHVGDNVTPYSVNNTGVVAGYDFDQYFKWTVGGGYQGIGGQIPGNGHGGIPSISSNGSRVGGTAMNTATGKSEMAYYDDASGVWTPVGSLGGSSDASASAGFAMSGDGQILVGNAWINAGTAHAVRWQGGTMTDLGSLFSGASSRADGVSDDGSLIGGYQDRADGYRSAAVWVNGTESLIDFNGEPLAAVHAVSGDGNWALGGGGYALNYSAYRWSPTTGLEAFDNPFYDLSYEMVATASNWDGSIVIGYARDFTGFGWGSLDQGWIWTEAGGVQTMEAYATSLGYYGGEYLTNPLGISADGRYIVGQGLNAEGTSYIGWAMGSPVPEPASLISLAVGLGTLLRRRRK